MTQRDRDSDSGGDVPTSVAKAYVHEMLDFNPMWDSQQIIQRRREIWGGDPSIATSQGVGTAAPSAQQRLRDRARQCLDKVQEEFYQLPDAKLRQYLRTLHSDRLPEYAAIAARLQAATELRDTLLKVNAETGDPKFAYSLQQSVVRPAAEGAALREQYIEAICDERRVKPACAMVHQYVSDHPEVYALERNWFDMLLDPTNQNAWAASHPSRNHTGRLTLGGSGKWVFVALIVLSSVARLSSMVSRDSSSSSPSYSSPSYSSPSYSSPSYNAPAEPSYIPPHPRGFRTPSLGGNPPHDLGPDVNGLAHPQGWERNFSADAISPWETPQSGTGRSNPPQPAHEFQNDSQRNRTLQQRREATRQILQDWRARNPDDLDGMRSSDVPPTPSRPQTRFPQMPSHPFPRSQMPSLPMPRSPMPRSGGYP
ncbi:hypothetical protein [Allorhodopirellula heiligendammensis]|uniref:Uncharacterized protein n=1 Tax=Allorhodopirellula heiligendammensis TaxID=2714739 RepID=A0A5C6C0G6_9BACT|nr:hypothetical protein [Allorhodopirellula heiligendammensis]TWU16369.1 hypothetical protein Poly21_35740 [Allorhodopirellula heiligendammensis]